MSARPLAAALAMCGAALALALTGCHRAVDPACPSPVARVGTFALDRPAFERFVLYETGLKLADLDPRGAAGLYEELLAEALFARGAERAGLAVPSDALAKERVRLAAITGAGDDAAGSDARRRLLAALYVQRQFASPAAVDRTALERELKAAETGAAERITFRQLRAETAAEAERALARIRRGEPFEAVAAELSQSPDQGRPLRRAWPELPEPVAAALRAAPPGGLAGPVALDGAYYVFKLVPPDSASGTLSARGRADIERRLAQLGDDDRRQRKLAELARMEGVRAPRANPVEDTAR